MPSERLYVRAKILACLADDRRHPFELSANGYLFFGMPGNYNDNLLCQKGPEIRPLFVGIPKPQSPGTQGWYYLGTYSFSIQPPPLGGGLHVDEWNALTPKARHIMELLSIRLCVC